MKKIALTLLVLISCSLSAVLHAAPANPIQVVQKKFEAFNRHDVSTIESLYGPQATLQSPDYPQLSGNANIAQTYRQLFKAIPDARDTVVKMDVIANRVYAQFLLTGHFGGDQSNSVSVKIISVYTIERDRIVSDSTYYDRKHTP